MRTGKPHLVGLLALALTLSACGADATSDDGGAASALAEYTAPAEAPALCAEIAGSRSFPDIAPALGQLVAGADVDAARERLSAARTDLKAMVIGVPHHEWPELREAADGVIAELRAVLEPPVSADARGELLAGMDDFVGHLQQVCEFPA